MASGKDARRRVALYQIRNDRQIGAQVDPKKVRSRRRSKQQYKQQQRQQQHYFRY